MKTVIFGAGNIGRGFLGLELTREEAEITFIDANEILLRQMKERGSYTVTLINGDVEHENVSGYNVALLGSSSAVAATREAEIILTAVGPQNLRSVGFQIARSFEGVGAKPRNVIACENMDGNSSALRRYVAEAIGERALQNVGFPDCVVDRISFVNDEIRTEDPLGVGTEKTFTWEVDVSAIKGDLGVECAKPVEDISIAFRKKLYVLNGPHAVAAYIGRLQGYNFIHEVMNSDASAEVVRRSAQEAAAGVSHEYGISGLEIYAEKVLRRFSNPLVSDPVTRVGRNPIRKLQPQERLFGPAELALKHGTYPYGLAAGIEAAFDYSDPRDEEAVMLQRVLGGSGNLSSALTSYRRMSRGILNLSRGVSS